MFIETNPYLAVYAALPLASAIIHRNVKKPVIVVVFVIGYALLGWLLLFAALSWNDAQWMELMQRTPNPSDKLLEQFQSDGASNAFTLFFGLPVSIIYCSFWWLVLRGLLKLKNRPKQV
jgi:hypothetical protein